MRLNRALTGAALLLPGGLTVFLAFSGGGFFAGTTALAAVALALVLVVRVTLVEEPFGWGTGGFLLAGAALALFTVWTFLSASWSDAPARALLEYNRALLYLLALVLFGSFRRTPGRVRLMLGGLAIGMFVVCAAALISRAAPDLWPVTPGIETQRLSYPVTYWNALGLLAALGSILCFHLASSEREPRAARVLGAAALPTLAATLLLTYSRGAIAVAAGGLLAYAVVGRPRSLPLGLVATAPGAAVAAVLAYRAELLGSPDPTTAAAVAQGHDLLLVVGLCTVGAALLRGVLLPLDARLAGLRLPGRLGPIILGGAGLALVVALVATAVAADLPDRLDRQYERFVKGDPVTSSRQRLTEVSNNNRLNEWRVALDAYRDSRVHGDGAGTFVLRWARDRPTQGTARDAHSLYLEVLGELGIVGLAALAIALATVLLALALRSRGPDRAVYGGLFAAGAAWAVHAGIDWDWEMPVTTLWLFAAGGLALAAPATASAVVRTPGRLTRVVVALGCLLVAVTPVRIALSQDRLNDGVSALKRGDCAQAIDAALASNSAVGVRPEPFEVLGYCDMRLGARRLGVEMMKRAVARDPRNWELHYGLALTRGAAGLDPRRAAARALRLNPHSDLAKRAATGFDTTSPARWRRRALKAPLPLG